MSKPAPMKKVNLSRLPSRKGMANQPVYSVREAGRVIGQVTAITLVGVSFDTAGSIQGCRDLDPRPSSSEPSRVVQKPRGFFRVDTGEAVASAHRVDVRPDGIFAWF